MNEFEIDRQISDIVDLQPFIASEVQLRRNLWRSDPETNARRIENYFPTQTSRTALRDMLKGTSASTRRSVHLLTGSYGTGKSYLLLVLANLLGRSLESENLQTLTNRIEKGEGIYKDGLLDEIEKAKDLEGFRYFVVVPDYSENNFDRAMLESLRHALEREDIDYRPKTNYRYVIDLLNEWKNKKTDVVDKIRVKANEDGTSLERIRANLEEYSPEALRKVEEYYEDIMVTPLSYQRVKVEDTYKDIARHLRDEHDYRGIAVLFDEFGYFLKEFVNTPDAADGQAVQDFIEFVKKERGANMLLILAAHRSLADYVKGDLPQEDIEKMAGRFEQKHRLKVSSRFNEAEEMIANTVIPNSPKKDEYRRICNELSEMYESESWERWTSHWYSNQTNEWILDTVVEGGYPLHPATTYVLPQISDKVAQNTRTMFNFMAADESGGISSFIEARAVHGEERLSLYTIDKLYDYFIGATEAPDSNQLDAAQIRRQYQRAKATIQVTEPLADRLLKAIAVISVIADPQLQATAENLTWVLNLPLESQKAVEQLLMVLKEQGAVRQNKNTGIYKFRGAGQASIERLHKKHLGNIGQITVEQRQNILNEVFDIGQKAHKPFGYNDDYSTNREVTADFWLPRTARDSIQQWAGYFDILYEDGEGKDYKGNALVLYGIAETQKQIEEFEDVLGRVPDKYNGLFVFAIQHVSEDLTSHIVDYIVSKKVVQDPKVQGNDEAKEEASQVASEYREKLGNTLHSILKPGNFAWYYRGEEKYTVGELDEDTKHNWFDNIIERTFDQTPIIRYGVLQRYPEGRDHHRSKRHKAMDEMLDGVAFTCEGSSVEKNMLQALLQGNQMFEERQRKNNKSYGVVVEPTEGSKIRVAWDVLEENLLTSGRESRLTTAARTLYSPPFGMSHPAVDALIAAFIGHKIDDFTLKKQGSIVAITGSNIAEAINNPSRYSLRYQFITPGQRRYLDSLLSTFLDDGPEKNRSLGVWLGTAEAMKEWYRCLPQVTRALAAKENTGVASLFSVLEGLVEKETDDSQRAKEILVKELPTEFGFSEQQVDDRRSSTKLVEKIATAKNDAEEFEEEYAEGTLGDIAYRVFDKQCGGSQQFRKIIDHWHGRLSLATQLHFKNEIDHQGGDLIKIAGRQGHVVEQFLVDLPQLWDYNTYKEWENEQVKNRYIKELRQAAREVETYEESPVPVLNRIAGDAFGKEIESPEEFQSLFKTWYSDLGKSQRERFEANKFSDHVRYLRDAIIQEGTVEKRYLQDLPERMSVTGGIWPNMHQIAVNDLAAKITEAIQEVEDWEPALAPEDCAELICKRAWNQQFTSEEQFESLCQEWYSDLTPATKRHQFERVEFIVLEAVRSEQGLLSALESDIPREVDLPVLSQADDARVGEELAKCVVCAIQRINDWKRPLLDVLRLTQNEVSFVEDGELQDESEFTLYLQSWWDKLYNKPPESEFSADKQVLYFIEWAKAGANWKEKFYCFVAAHDLPEEHHQWTKKDDEQFVEGLKSASNRVEEWEPSTPSDEEIRARIRKGLKEIATQTNVDRKRLAKIVLEVVQNGDL